MKRASERRKELFKQRVRKWADTMDVSTTSIAVRPMSNKWASCSTNGRLTFDGSLLKLQDDLQDYVIVHELLHFYVPNHGKLWKSLMTAYLGNYQRLDARLKRAVNWAD